MEENSFPINKISDYIGNFDTCSHKFIQDPNFNKSHLLDSIFNTKQEETNQHPHKKLTFDEKSFYDSMKKPKKEVIDNRFSEKLLKDAFKYMYYSQKMKHVPEYKEHRRKIEEIDENIKALTIMGTLYLIYIIFKKIDLRMTYYDKVDDIIRDKPRKLYITNKPFHISMIVTSFSLLFWNISKSRRLEKEFQDLLKEKYLKNLEVSKKHPKTLISL